MSSHAQRRALQDQADLLVVHRVESTCDHVETAALNLSLDLDGEPVSVLQVAIAIAVDVTEQPGQDALEASEGALNAEQGSKRTRDWCAIRRKAMDEVGR